MQRIELPGWLLPTCDSIEHAEIGGLVRMIDSPRLAMMTLDGGKQAIMVFTTLAKAEAYAATCDEEMYPLALPDPQAFIMTIDALNRRGILALVFDDDDGDAYRLDGILAAARSVLGDEVRAVIAEAESRKKMVTASATGAWPTPRLH